jgi:SnoaL-like domain
MSIRDEIAAALEQRDFERFASLLAEDVRFYGMLSEEPAVGRRAVMGVFAMLVAICDEVQYAGEYAGDDGVVLVSRGLIDGQRYEALQMLRLDGDGRIVEFHDTIRPIAALDALRAAVAQYLRSQSKSR